MKSHSGYQVTITTIDNHFELFFPCLLTLSSFSSSISEPYVCNIGGCQKRFNYSYHLRRHMETHSGERPYICTWPDCGQSFNRKYNLHRHVMGVHAEKMKTTAT